VGGEGGAVAAYGTGRGKMNIACGRWKDGSREVRRRVYLEATYTWGPLIG